MLGILRDVGQKLMDADPAENTVANMVSCKFFNEVTCSESAPMFRVPAFVHRACYLRPGFSPGARL